VILLSPQAVTQKTIQPEWDARVFALNHTAKNLLTRLKVWDALDLQRVAPVESMQVFGSGLQTTSDSGLQLDAYAAHQEAMAWIVEGQNLNQALDAALRFAPNVQIVVGKTRAMSPDFMDLSLENGDVIEADLWVGADGAQSWVRNQAGIGLDYRSYGQRGVVANFACAKPHHGIAHQWFIGEQGVVALLPLPGQQVSLVWSAPEALAQTLMQEGVDLLAQRLALFCDTVLGSLTPLPPQQVRSFPLNFISPHAIVGPHLALVGDAAHVVHPVAGHGMNLGFSDVVALLESVTERESWRSCGDPRVLQRYARSRKEEVLLMQLTTDGLIRLFGIQSPMVQTGLKLGMNVLNQLPFLKNQLIQHAMGK
jgi:ubiquinone biosynthesis UbiH/UbiF/VisC/COQ6 family hydroxylase